MASRNVYYISKNESLITDDKKKQHRGTTNKAFIGYEDDNVTLTSHIHTIDVITERNGVGHVSNGVSNVAVDVDDRITSSSNTDHINESSNNGNTNNAIECRPVPNTSGGSSHHNGSRDSEYNTEGDPTTADCDTHVISIKSANKQSHIGQPIRSKLTNKRVDGVDANTSAINIDAIPLEDISEEGNDDSVTTDSFSAEYDYCRGDFERDASTTDSSLSGSTFKRSASYGDKPARRRTGATQTHCKQLDTGQSHIDRHVDFAGDVSDRYDDNDDKWRVSLEEFTSKRYGSKRKSRTLTKQMREFYEQQHGLVQFYAGYRTYYKNQDNLINQYEEIRLELDDAMENAETTKLLRKKASLYAKATFFVNLLLLAIKVVAVVLSGSISLISSLVDSTVDLVSGVVIWATTRAVKRTDRYLYPQGRTKLEPMSIVILSVIMSVASLQIIKESVAKIVGLADGSTSPPVMYLTTVGISSATVVIKLILYILCRRVPHPTVQALAMDHRNDVVSNFFAIVFGYIGSQEMKDQTQIDYLVYVDPIGAIVISIYIIANWCITGWDQIKLLIGHTAHAHFISKVTWICMDHHRKILKVDTVRAFHFGNNFLVEADIVLPPEMTLREAHDIAEPLQQKIERLPKVERAWVHIDYETDHDPKIEHMVK